MPDPIRVAILDDYQGVALELADWSAVRAKAQLDVFTDHLTEPEAVVARLAAYDVLCVMRERTPLSREILNRLPRLKVIASTGKRNVSIDVKAAEELGIKIFTTGYSSDSTIEFTWAMILASLRHLPTENAALRSGGWQQCIGGDLAGQTLGIIGLGSIGGRVAQIAVAFGMKVVAWSQNLTPAVASAAGATWVSKETLLREADIVTIHLVLSQRSRGTIGAAEIALMKRSAHLINTSRGPIVEETALLEALGSGRIAGAAVDVYDVEPLPTDHPFRSAPRLLATPHIGYVTHNLYQRFYRDTAENVAAWLDQRTE